MTLRSVSRCLLPILLPACLAACSSIAPAPPPAASDALWRVIQRDCRPADRQPGCLLLDESALHRHVLVKDHHGAYQYLLMPLDKISGIESAALYQPGSPNYFAAAWQARRFTEQALGRPLPRRFASLALNSPHGRSQHQLHIHVDCLRGEVAEGVAAQLAGLDSQWRPLPTRLRDHAYQALYLPGEQLTANPLHLLEQRVGLAAIGEWSLLVAGAEDAERGPGFVLLATRVDPESGNEASAEELQDHACAALTGSAQALERER
ncbi:CDP-diacylglycerol diphosphatase [Stenotrophomonas chelatiphaga]|uniref:CDP-diacylglycerol diphosphatase n=1 Tax=Stenotrophomonas chelatiphaga TaxID=517011 RepID=UPI002898E6AD|nr:CDP-diacylglycerol diphosphatase [Stenotrophomonas chelatiphaga]